MKKKAKIRDQREAKKNEKIAHRQEEEERRKEAERKAAEEAAKLKEEKEKRKVLSLVQENEQKMPGNSKSQVKATGVKSVFSLNGNTLLMTSFGKGNDAIREKKVEGGIITNIADEPSFSILEGYQEIGFSILGRTGAAFVDNPLHSGETNDVIYCRKSLEQKYFARVFRDNIHIQLIYNILDIDKILAVHINNIVYEINNLLRYEGAEYTDLIGNLSTDKSYETFKNNGNKGLVKQFEDLIKQPQLGYFGIVITKEDDKKKNNTSITFSVKEFYYILALLGQLRQALAHGNAEIYNFDQKKEAYDTLSRLYSSRVQGLNDEFIDNSSKNIVLLVRAFNVTALQEQKALIRDYYDFAITKEYKNLGLSLKKLREIITNYIPQAEIIRDQEYDSVRSKVNSFFDFIVFRLYRENAEHCENTVDRLRGCMNDSEKEAVYVDEAFYVWDKIGNQFINQVLPELNGESIHGIDIIHDFLSMFIDVSKFPEDKKERRNAARDALKDVSDQILGDVMISEDAEPFTKLMYLLTVFLDGKEINDLLTTLINKFENIDSFLNVINESGLSVEFRPAYRMFAKSGVIAKELRIVNSFARMTKETLDAKGIMYQEAAYVLGFDDSNISDYLDATMFRKNYDDKLIDTGFRNFIAHNVVESSRFKYLVRYANVRKVREIANNRGIIDFVLKEIPDAQIVRYYNSCYGTSEVFNDSMRIELAKQITNMNFRQFESVHQNDRNATLIEREEKQRKQAVIRLYLTVLYLIVKNLVYINSRYFLAFHCVERDRLLYNKEKWGKIPGELKMSSEYGFGSFSREFLEDHPHNKHAMGYIRTNLENSDEWAIRAFRNTVDHIGAVRNAHLYLKDLRKFDSWFDVYHYLAQRAIMDTYQHDSTTLSKSGAGNIVSVDELNPKTLEYFSMVEKYHTSCRDFIKALNIPFAYNLARYKNLSIDGLFDKNRPGRDNWE